MFRSKEKSMPVVSTRWRTAALASAALLALAACGSSGDGSSDGDGDKVTLMLNWYPYGEHAPFYYGVEEGIFADHGIDLEIQAGQGSTKTVQATGQGQVDFGWADTPPVLANIDSGVDVRSVGVFLQTTPSAVQVFADSGIDTPQDLEGKTIAVSAGDAPTTTFPLYLDAVGVDESSVKQQNLDPAGKISAMISGKVDGLIGFAHDQGPTVAHRSEKEVKYLRYSDEGLNFYSNGLIASDKTIDSDSDLVERMVAATSEAFEAAAENPEDAAASMEGKDPQIPPTDVVLEQWEETMELLTTENTEGQVPGTNDEADWQNTIEILAKAKILDSEQPVDTYYDDSFAPGGGE